MPFTPYHFGPSGFIGLVFRRWIDVPVFVLANVVVDIEVLVIWFFNLGWPRHRYFHTLLIGMILGVIWGLVAFILRGLLNKLMYVFCVPYKSNLHKMVISGILGVWLHNLIDGMDHFDVNLLWPNKTLSLYKVFHGKLNTEQIETVCVFFIFAAIVPYLFAVRSFLREDGI